MSWVSTVWSMIAPACFTMGAMRVLVYAGHAKRKIWLNVLLLPGLLAGFNASAAKTYRDDPAYLIDSWETEDGLPENSATAMAQTPDGYLWLGTFQGLARFDGV